MDNHIEQERVVEQVVAAGHGAVAAGPGHQPIATISAARVGWSAVFAGVIATAGVWLLLYTLGVGIGLTAVEPEDPSSLRGVGIGTGIWSIIAPILALFVGGMVTRFVAGPIPRLSGLIHGMIMWSIATVASIALVVSLVSSVVGGAVRVSGQVVGATGAAAVTGLSGLDGATLESLGLDANDIMGPINQQLREEGKPEITADQLNAAARDALRTAVREGRLDRQILISSLAENTPLSREDAREIAAKIEREWQRRADELSRLGEQAQETALQAAESTGKGLLALFGLMALGLVATAGGVLAVDLRQRRRVYAPRATARGVPRV